MFLFKHHRREPHLTLIRHVYCQPHKAAIKEREPGFNTCGHPEAIVSVQEGAEVMAKVVHAGKVSVGYSPAAGALDLSADVIVVKSRFKPIVQPQHKIVIGVRIPTSDG